MLDIRNAKVVDFYIDQTGKVWVNVDGKCEVRVGRAECINLDDPLRGQECFITGLTDMRRSHKRFEAGGGSYGRAETEALREQLIQLRDGALRQGEMEWSVAISHMIALWHGMIEHIWGPKDEEPRQGDAETTEGG